MPAVLVATWGDDGTPDAMTAAWSAICCHEPPCLGVAVRQIRLTHKNLLERDAFTVNVARATKAAEVDYLGIVSGKKQADKVARAGLRVRAGSEVDAPIIEDCPVNIECALKKRVQLGTHDWIIGEIRQVHVDAELVDEKDKVDIEALDPLVFCPSRRSYHRLGEELARAFDVGKTIER